MIAAADLDLLKLTDDPDEAVRIVVDRGAELRAAEQAAAQAAAEAQVQGAAAESSGW